MNPNTTSDSSLSFEKLKQALEEVFKAEPWRRHVGTINLIVSDHLQPGTAVSFPRSVYEQEHYPHDKTIGTAVVSREAHRIFQAVGCSNDELAAMVWHHRTDKPVPPCFRPIAGLNLETS